MEVFTDLSVWVGIRRAIEQVNANAVAAQESLGNERGKVEK